MSTLCVLAVEAPVVRRRPIMLIGGRHRPGVGAALGRPGFPKLLRPLAAWRAAPTSRSVKGNGFPWPLTPLACGEKG
jgi:hypothetical protein